MTESLERFLFKASEAGVALSRLAQQAGHTPREADLTLPKALDSGQGPLFDDWLEATADCQGFEAEPCSVGYNDVWGFVRKSAPLLLRIPNQNKVCFVAIVGCASRNRVQILAPDQSIHLVSAEQVQSAWCHEHEIRLLPQIDRLLQQANIPPKRISQARRAVLSQRLGRTRVEGAWLVRLSQQAHFGKTLRRANVFEGFAKLVGYLFLQHGLWLTSWYLLGKGVLEGKTDWGWLAAWMLLLMTIVPIRAAAEWTRSSVAIISAGLVKLRLLAGTLRLGADEIRREGAGQYFARSLESHFAEKLAIRGGYETLLGGTQLIMAGWVLSQGSGGILLALLLALWVALGATLCWRHYRSWRRWSLRRISMTHGLVERMVGHRTRLAQQTPDKWHLGEDKTLRDYLNVSDEQDRKLVWFEAFAPSGWLVVGLIGLAPSFITGASSIGKISVAFGGLLLAYQALRTFTSGFSNILGSTIAWEHAKPLFQAASRPPVTGVANLGFAPPKEEAPGSNPTVLLSAHDLSYQYEGRTDKVFQRLDLQIHQGERILLRGASGSGKSTLASLLANIRTPEGGVLLLRGLDRQTLGSSGWRRRVTLVPQFHENHIFADTVAFNILMGRRWPPTSQDLSDAEDVCHAVGLGPLLARMPCGLMQIVGEMGWQLSHGEKSRLFMARALLQPSELIIMDESFTALDPKGLQQSLCSILERVPTLVVIAHVR